MLSFFFSVVCAVIMGGMCFFLGAPGWAAWGFGTVLLFIFLLGFHVERCTKQ